MLRWIEKMSKPRALLTAVLLGSIWVGLMACSSAQVPLKVLNAQATSVIDEADKLVAVGKIEEAVVFITPLAKLHPNDPRIKAIMDKLNAKQKEALFPPKWMGYNKGKRGLVEPTMGERIMWYIPDRIFDVLDIITVEARFGWTFGLGVWATKAVQVQLMTNAAYGFGYGQKRQLYYHVTSGFDIGALMLVGTAEAKFKAGTGGLEASYNALAVHAPSNDIYQNSRDFWAVGGQFGIFVFGFLVEVHPLEIGDFLTGLFLWDPLNDDFATTRALRFSDTQKSLIESLVDSLGKMKADDLLEYQRKFPSLAGGGTGK